MTETPTILKLKIDRFRGLQALDWKPSSGMNIVLGGGDAGKTTILDAIALLLSPSNSFVLSYADYWQRKVENEFVIQPILALLAAGCSVATIWVCALRKPEQVTVGTDRLSVWLLNQLDTLELGDREVSAPT